LAKSTGASLASSSALEDLAERKAGADVGEMRERRLVMEAAF
jgi:hypothetical protein